MRFYVEESEYKHGEDWIDISLEKECQRCYGLGYTTEKKKKVECPSCNGVGYILTQYGEEVAGFFNRWFRKSEEEV